MFATFDLGLRAFWHVGVHCGSDLDEIRFCQIMSVDSARDAARFVLGDSDRECKPLSSRSTCA